MGLARKYVWFILHCPIYIYTLERVYRPIRSCLYMHNYAHNWQQIWPGAILNFYTDFREPYWKCMQCSWTVGLVSTCHLVLFLFLFLFLIVHCFFLSIVNNLTQHWCAWDHATCMYMGTPRADWHAPMCAGVESGYLPFILAFNFNLIWLYCNVCASICVVHKYFIVILIIFIHSTTCQHLSQLLIYTFRVFCTAIHWWTWLYSHWHV